MTLCLFDTTTLLGAIRKSLTLSTISTISCIELQILKSSRFVHFINNTALSGRQVGSTGRSEDFLADSSTDLLRQDQQHEWIDEYGQVVDDQSLKAYINRILILGLAQFRYAIV